jgi:transcriptional regulator with XRE-family HTH domain
MKKHRAPTIGELLFDARTRLRLSQDDVAVGIGRSRNRIGLWETGRALPTREEQQKIADVFIELDGAIGRALAIAFGVEAHDVGDQGPVSRKKMRAAREEAFEVAIKRASEALRVKEDRVRAAFAQALETAHETRMTMADAIALLRGDD